MSDAPAATPTPSVATSAQLAELVTTATRFLGGLAANPVLTGIGLSEWSTLSALAQGKSNNGRLARSMGVTKQRMNQIVTSLAGHGYVTVTKSSEDSRKGEIAITEAGTAQLATIDAELAPALTTALKGQERAVQGANKYMKAVSKRLLAPAAAA